MARKKSIYNIEAGLSLKQDIEELQIFQRQIRKQETELLAYVNPLFRRSDSMIYLIHGSMFQTHGVFAEFPLDRNITLPAPNSKLKMNVTWQVRLIGKRSKGRPKFEKSVYVHSWTEIPRKFKKLPYKYEEFSEIAATAIGINFKFRDEYLLGQKTLEDYLLANLISTPPLEISNPGGIFTGILTHDQRATSSKRLLDRIQLLMPSLSTEVKVGKSTYPIKYFSFKTMNDYLSFEKSALQARSSVNASKRQLNSEISIDVRQSLRRYKLDNIDIPLTIPGEIHLSGSKTEVGKYQDEIITFIYDSLQNFPTIEVKPEEVLDISQQSLQNLGEEVRLRTKDPWTSLAISAKFPEAMVRVSLNLARRQGVRQVQRKHIIDAANVLETLNLHTFEETQFSLNPTMVTSSNPSANQTVVLRVFEDLSKSYNQVTEQMLIRACQEHSVLNILDIMRTINMMKIQAALLEYRDKGITYLKTYSYI